MEVRSQNVSVYKGFSLLNQSLAMQQDPHYCHWVYDIKATLHLRFIARCCPCHSLVLKNLPKVKLQEPGVWHINGVSNLGRLQRATPTDAEPNVEEAPNKLNILTRWGVGLQTLTGATGNLLHRQHRTPLANRQRCITYPVWRLCLKTTGRSIAFVTIVHTTEPSSHVPCVSIASGQFLV